MPGLCAVLFLETGDQHISHNSITYLSIWEIKAMSVLQSFNWLNHLNFKFSVLFPQSNTGKDLCFINRHEGKVQEY